MSDFNLNLSNLQQAFRTTHELGKLYPEGTRQRECCFEIMNLIRSEVSERFGYEEMLCLNLLVKPSV